MKIRLIKRPLAIFLLFVIPVFSGSTASLDQNSLAYTLCVTAKKLHQKMPRYFGEIQQIAENILALWPAQNTLLISLGRGPSVFTTYLKTLRPTAYPAAHLLELPFSNYPRPAAPSYFSTLLTDDAAEKTFLEAYFQQWIVPQLTAEISQIMVMDYVHSGLSMLTFTYMLRTFLADHYPQIAEKISWQIIAIAAWPIKTDFNTFTASFKLPPAKIIPIPPTMKIARPLVWHYFDQFAPFKEYPVDEYIRWISLADQLPKPQQGQLTSMLTLPPHPLPNQKFYEVLVQEFKRSAVLNCVPNLQTTNARPPAVD